MFSFICMFCRSLFVFLYFFFLFGHCYVCSSSIYGFWLPLWYLQTLLTLRHIFLQIRSFREISWCIFLYVHAKRIIKWKAIIPQPEEFQNSTKKSLTDQNSITLTHLYDRSLSWLGTSTSRKSGGVKLVSWVQTNFKI